MASLRGGWACVAFALLAACSGGTEGVDKTQGKTDVFKESVLPLIAADCSGPSCHSPGGAGATFLTVSTSSAQTYQSLISLVKPGSSATSAVMTSMGMDYASAQTRSALKSWIDSGAPQYGESGAIPPPTPPAYAGMDVCANYCHSRQAEQWLNGPHSNDESIDSSYVKFDAGLLNSGFPTLADLSATGCAARCHDQLGDGRSRLIPDFTGNRPRPVIGCESCHGAGGDHYGTPSVAMPYGSPDAFRCGTCHNETLADFGEHSTYHPEAIDLKAKFLASPHARSRNEHVFAEVPDGSGGTVASKTAVTGVCSRCHTDEGAREKGWVAPTFAAVNAEIDFASPPLASPSAIECRTCHKVHEEDKLWVGANGSGSAEFNTCVNCHAVSDAFHGIKSAYAWTRQGGAQSPDFLYTGSGSIIYDTHFDDPSTPAKIEGYVVRSKSERACRDCHDVHSVENTRQLQWAGSAHGGRLAGAKKLAAEKVFTVADPTKTPDKEGIVPAVFAAASLGEGTGAPGEVVSSLAHYDWDAPDRQACQRCHTATGASNYLTSGSLSWDGRFTFDPTLYNPAKNDFTHLAGWSGTKAGNGVFSGVVSSEQNELIYCWGCHTDTRGGLRNPGATQPNFNRWNQDGTAAPALYADGGNLGRSNVCAACHSGRGNGGNVASIFSIAGALNPALATSANPANYPAKVFPSAGPAAFTPTQTHYMNAAATLKHSLLKPGYEYPGVSYANVPWFTHDFAAELAKNPNSEGPCVVCHMAGANHELSPFDGATGEPVGACSVEGCHTGQYAVTRASIEEEEEAYKEAKALLKEELKKKGVLYKPDAYPYVVEVYLPGATTGTPGAELPGNVQFRKWSDWTKWPEGASTAQPVGFTSEDLGVNPADATKHLYAFTYTGGGDEGFAGAAHNLAYLTKEGGAFVHDSLYAKRLLFDSIYYMRNHASPPEGAALDLTANPKVAVWFSEGQAASGAVPRP